MHDSQGKIIGTIGVAFDVSERRRVEREARLLEAIALSIGAAADLDAALQLVLERVCQATGWLCGQAWTPAADGSVLECSPAYHAAVPGLEPFRTRSQATRFPPAIGLPGRVWVSKQPAWIPDVTLDTNFPRVPAALDAGLRAGMGIPILAEGEVVAVLEFFVRERRQEDEGLIQLVSAVAAQVGNVIERRRAEDARRRSQEQLLRQQEREREIVEAELAKVREELVRKTRLAALGQVAGTIAHELRNPLGAIRNAVYLLRRRVPRTDPKSTEYLGIIDHETVVSDQIITNLLEMTRPRELVRQEVDLVALVRESFGRAAPPAGVAWSLTGPAEVVLRADPILVRQVVDNLLRNALDAVGPSGEIRVAVEENPAYAILTVQDTGPGVPLEHRASLFEPLFSTKVKGTGLGLFLSRQIVERHGGTLKLVEGGGSGAVFLLRLPRGSTTSDDE